MRLKPNVNLEEDIEWSTDERVGDQNIKTAWFSAAQADTPAKKQEVEAELFKAKKSFRLLCYIIALKYKKQAARGTTFSDPNYVEELIYSKGYEQALKDIYNLIPQKVIDQKD